MKNWKDHFFWLDDLCLPKDLPWRLKDQSMNFEIKADFAFDRVLAQNLVDHRSPIRPLPEHFLLLSRVSRVWGHGDKDWPVISSKKDGETMSLRDALQVPNFKDLDFGFLETTREDAPFLTQTTPAAFPLRNPETTFVNPDPSDPTREAPTEGPSPTKPAFEVGSSHNASTALEILEVNEDEDSDPEIQTLDRQLGPRPFLSSSSLPKGKRNISISSPLEPQKSSKKRKSNSDTFL
ncbi:hypothetical protein HanRHA438_Chr17g0821501 [Helianthus annuus]|nr:hypothetical protein HanIR_Chr17g0880611 [Helianthus annuus]KAJ0448152.1 hypothetical protein HanHA89_Chr17g0713551 [Helianthus annuus]KAJ0633037.1 hypothetical protein HanLR1_Chr17g0672041 [Helianthus annuus]KAJ0636835.1 hypothetical protein HanOQP8_Chr17g0666671 [Helianthus annuus]KAJ0668276.1 hypothetical protein HanPI659440_Chr17g0687321 [Helianthus annuus]